MAADPGNRQYLAAQTQNPAPVAIRTVCRQTSKVGAVCGQAARTDLCGGRSVMGVPTAIDIRAPRSRARRAALPDVGYDLAQHSPRARGAAPTAATPVQSSSKD